MATIEAQDVEEAVAVCATLQKAGRYDWFRGQTRDWPLRSSFIRLDSEQREEGLRQTARFDYWVKRTYGLEPLVLNPDMAVAAAQHYGLPTNFIDFTTDPIAAGFFASTEPDQVHDNDEHSCILCLNTVDLENFWKSMPQKFRKPEFITLTVPNLWRLEAQSGVFLFCPYTDFEHIYTLDRIIFPPTKLTGGIPEHGYSPERKSPLELQLDQFFMNETLMEGNAAASSIFKKVYFVPGLPGRCNPLIFAGGDLPIHESWNSDSIEPWLEERTTHLSELVAINLSLEVSDSPDEARNAFRSKMETMLNEDPTLRSKLVKFTYSFAAPPQGVSSERNITSAARLWEGLRRLPFTDEEIATGLGNCLALQLWWSKPGLEEIEAAANTCFGDSLEVALGAPDGSHATAYVEEDALLGCVRSDISTFLVPETEEEVEGSIIGLVLGCSDPTRLFDFRPLASLFATQICPVQVITRRDMAVYYSPACLDSFGLP